jgi:hypothetical protein
MKELELLMAIVARSNCRPGKEVGHPTVRDAEMVAKGMISATTN